MRAPESNRSVFDATRTRRRFTSLISIGSATIALLMLVAFLRERAERKGAEYSRHIESIAAVAPRERSFDGRLSNFSYRPPARIMRGSERGVTESVGAEFYVRLSQVADEAKRIPSAANLHSLGVAYLLMGRPKHSLDTLGDAMAKQTNEVELPKAIRASRDARLLNDFGVAAIAAAQAESTGDAAGGAAIEATQRAWQLRKNAETSWNRAVALEQIGMEDAARSAWRDYARFDRSSAWTEEATKHIRRLEAEVRLDARPPTNLDITRLLQRSGHDGAAGLAAQWPSACRSYVDEFLLSALIEASTSNDSQAIRRLLSYATSLSRAVGERGGDTSLANAAMDLGRSLIEQPDSSRTKSLLTAVGAYADARQKYRAGDISAAASGLSGARVALRRVSSELSKWADFYLACCAYYDAAYDRCLSQLAAESDASMLGAGLRALVANRHWVRGLAFSVQNRRGESIIELERAQELFEFMGERDNIAAIASLVAEVREYLGDRELASRSRRIATSLLPAVSDPLRRGRILNEAVEAAVNKDWLWTALLLQDQVVDESTRSARSLDAADAFMWRGLIWSRLSETSRARDDFERATRLLPLIDAGPVRDKTAADLAFCKVAAMPKFMDNAALESAAAFYSHAGNRVRLSELYRLQAFAAVDRGAFDEGEDLLRRSLQEIRFGQQGLSDLASKLVYTASASQVASAVAQKLLRRGESDRAFALLEDIRNARSLKPSVAHPRLPDDTAAVFYFVGDETSYAWVMRGGRIRAVPLHCRRGELLALLTAISEHLAVDGLRDPRTKSAVSSLYDDLIAPVAELLQGAGVVVAVPDEAIANVPFPALLNRRTGRYLVQDILIVAAPSISAYSDAQRNADRAIRLPLDRATVLLSDPRTNGIAPLPELNRETAAVRGIARSVQVIGGDGGDVRAAAADGFRNAPFLHFGGHGEFNAASPADSALVIGGSPGGVPTRLTAREIVGQSPAAKLVVLSACDSGRMSRSVPSAGIAQWLVASGVTSVIATISPVDDAAAADLICDYYRYLKRSPDSASALRSAQIAALKRGDDVGWPVFIHFGAPRRIEYGGSTHEN